MSKTKLEQQIDAKAEELAAVSDWSVEEVRDALWLAVSVYDSPVDGVREET